VDTHKNAKLTPRGRGELVDFVLNRGRSYRQAAHAFKVDPKTVSRWVKRYQAEGPSGLLDRSSCPKQCHRRTPRYVARRICRLRRKQRLSMDEIARREGVSRATVARILSAAGLSRLTSLDPKPPMQRYEHPYPGSMIHLDIKKLGRFRYPGHRVTRARKKRSRGMGWEYAHVAIDDHSRVGLIQIWPDEKAASAWRALIGAVRYFRALGVTVERVLTDNGACYISRRFAAACRRLGIKHRRTRPYRPRTNGKAERYIQTALREWAYAHRYNTSAERALQLVRWLHHYNWHRPHGSLGKRPPVSRLGLSEDNLLRLHT
jgi:transposase InsO family protein